MKTAIEVAIDALAANEEVGNIDGEVHAPTGWFARLTITNETLEDDLSMLRGVIMDDYEEDILANPNQLLGFWLVVNDNLGFIHLTNFRSLDELDAEYGRRAAEYADWLDANEQDK